MKPIKYQAYTELSAIVVFFILLNIVVSFFNWRVDLTEDKRFTLSEPTILLLENLDDVVYVQVFLDGELPSGFRKLKESTRDMLAAFKVHAGDNIQFEFIDPSAMGSKKQVREYYEELIEAGIEPINLEVKREDESVQKIIFPWVQLYYKNKPFQVKILQEQVGKHPTQVLSDSEAALEYELANALRKMQIHQKPKIAYISDYGTLNDTLTADFRKSIEPYYEVLDIEISRYKVEIIENFDMAIIAGPKERFEEVDKYKIDQFVMRGGKVIWLLETLEASLDSLDERGIGYTKSRDLNLDDQLFKYGVRVNEDLVQDLQSHAIPVMSNLPGSQGSRDFKPWTYYPVVFPSSTHPIVNNLNAIWFQFANSLDTVGPKNIQKTPLLSSSENSRLAFHPVRLNLQNIGKKPNERLFNDGHKTLAILLEGNFTSVFKNRIAPSTLESGDYGTFLEEAEAESKQIVIGDASVISNQYSVMRDEIYPLGFDRFTNQTFGNRNFMLNCVDYLLDDSGVLSLRSKSVKIRMLDNKKLKADKTFWQVMNLGVPIVIIFLLGFIFNVIRWRNYAR